MVDETKPIHPVVPRSRWPFTRQQIVGQVIVAAVILASGIGIGVGGTILSLKDRIVRLPRIDDRRPPTPPPELIEGWRADLGLTDEQVRQIKDMFSQRMTAAREQRKKMMELQRQEIEEFVASMKSILTAEQFAKWHKEFIDHVGHLRPRGPGGPGGPGGFDRRGKPDHQGGPKRPGGPDGHWDRGARDMKEPNFPAGGPPPDGPTPNDPPPQ
jgi:Spy/CpxP family protein refolding chaperone